MKKHLVITSIVFLTVAALLGGINQAIGEEECGFKCLFDGKTLNG